MEFSGFDWDDGNLAKCRKHGVSTETIESLFLRGLTILPDEAHSKTERRYLGIGRTEESRMLFVAFTLRRRGNEVRVRPISARYMHRKEVERYEKGKET